MSVCQQSFDPNELSSDESDDDDAFYTDDLPPSYSSLPTYVFFVIIIVILFIIIIIVVGVSHPCMVMKTLQESLIVPTFNLSLRKEVSDIMFFISKRHLLLQFV